MFIVLTVLAVTGSHPVTAQVAVSRDDAYRLAASTSPRNAVARADSTLAAAGLLLARQFENPTFSASYSRSEPQSHFSLDIPFDWPSLRSPRIAAAKQTLGAAFIRAQYGRASLALDVDTAYTRAQSEEARAALTARTASDADSLLTIAQVRRDAGDASDLDVELARVFAGQSRNAAVNDSLAAVNSMIVLQAIIGLRPDSVVLALSEHLSSPGDSVAPNVSVPAPTSTPQRSATPASGPSTFAVAAAEREADAANYRVLVEQRRRVAAPSLSVGFESIGPSSPGILPTIGVALPLPLFNRNTASIGVARAELARAQASVLLARIEQSASRNNAERNATAQRARFLRSQALVVSANRIAALSLVAYREGAAPLASVLDAQRTAREALSQFINDLAASRMADSVLRFLSLTPVAFSQ